MAVVNIEICPAGTIDARNHLPLMCFCGLEQIVDCLLLCVESESSAEVAGHDPGRKRTIAIFRLTDQDIVPLTCLIFHHVLPAIISAAREDMQRTGSHSRIWFRLSVTLRDGHCPFRGSLDPRSLPLSGADP